MNTIETFKRFQPMIEKAVWYNTKLYYPVLDKDEIQSQAYLIFVETLQTFNPNKASFCTYLHNELLRLNTYCYKQKKKLNRITYLENDISVDQTFNRFLETLEKIDTKISLSNDAQNIINYILKRNWEIPGNGYIRPSYHAVKRIYRCKRSWPVKRFNKAWNEISTWWKEA